MNKEQIRRAVKMAVSYKPTYSLEKPPMMEPHMKVGSFYLSYELVRDTRSREAREHFEKELGVLVDKIILEMFETV
jgi:hypothetical protein